jgi:hypothetical protein
MRSDAFREEECETTESSTTNHYVISLIFELLGETLDDMQIPKLRLDEETLSSIFITAGSSFIFQFLVRLIAEGDVHIDRIDRLGDDERLKGAVQEFYY